MFKLIVLNNDIEFVKNLCNHIFSEIPELQLSGFTSDFTEFEKLVAKVKPYIIMMDYSDYIHSQYTKKSDFLKMKILFCNTKPSSKGSSKQLLISKNSSLNEMKDLIKNFVSKENLRILRGKIIKLLENFQFDFKLLGTTYVLESILYCYENKTDYVFENLEKNVYPHVAIRCNTNADNVKWSIVRSVNAMNARIHMPIPKQLSNQLNLDVTEKTTAKQLISAIVTKLS